MTVLGELLDTIDVALRSLAQARACALAAAAAATEAHDVDRSFGVLRPVMTMGEVKGKVDAEVARITSTIANFERARLATRLLAGLLRLVDLHLGDGLLPLGECLRVSGHRWSEYHHGTQKFDGGGHSGPSVERGRVVVKIKRNTERAVRKAFGAAVAGEADRLDAAVTEIDQGSGEFRQQALALVVAIGATTLLSIHHGERPDNQQLRRMTKDFVDHEAWSGLDHGTALGYLTALADGPPPQEALPVSDPMFAACAVGGWLLSAFIPDQVAWTDFLDGILMELESNKS